MTPSTKVIPLAEAKLDAALSLANGPRKIDLNEASKAATVFAFDWDALADV